LLLVDEIVEEKDEMTHEDFKALPTTFSHKCGVDGWRRVMRRALRFYHSYELQDVINLSSTAKMSQRLAISLDIRYTLP